MSSTLHIRIKQEYAAAIIEDLQKKDAVEMVPEDLAFEVPQWQQEEVLKRIARYKDHPEEFIDEQKFFEFLNQD